jgi:hypothetical protein
MIGALETMLFTHQRRGVSEGRKNPRKTPL